MKGFDKIRNLNLSELDKKEETSEEMEVAVPAEEMVEEEVEETIAPIKKEAMKVQGKHHSVDAKMTSAVMQEFFFGHYYRQPVIILVTLIGIAMMGYSLVMRPASMGTYLIAGLFFVIGYPVSFISKAKTVVKKNPTFQQPFHYTFDEWGIHLKIGKDNLDIAWKYVIRVQKMKNIAVIYTGKNNGYLLPYADLGNRKEEILDFIDKMKDNNGR